MKILFCSGEVYPFSKTGGLADFSSALPKALKNNSEEVVVISPYYKTLSVSQKEMKFLGVGTVLMDNFKQEALYYQYILDGVRHIFVDNKQYFDREIYYNHVDDAERFTFFNLAVLESLPIIDFYPDIIHVNDWQTGLIPFFLDEKYRKNDLYKNIRTVLSVHNLEKQGAFPIEAEKLFNVKNYTYIHLGQVNFLKCGIMRADTINTVSKSYRDEILTKFYGFTLDGALKSRKNDLCGILNGLDELTYDPNTDRSIYHNYDYTNVKKGKEINKTHLINDLALENNHLPLVSIIGRFARQKGLNLLMDTFEDFLDQNRFNFIAVGKGDAEYELFFSELAKKYPKNVYYHEGFNHELQQKVYAASDIFLMPSLFEPCGLNQMVAMRYGTIPVVRLTGGLIDTVIPTTNHQAGQGFGFVDYDKDEFVNTLNDALNIYEIDPKKWSEIQKNAMNSYESMDTMAKNYEKLYQKLLNK